MLALPGALAFGALSLALLAEVLGSLDFAFAARMMAQAAIALMAPLGVPLANQAISASAFGAVTRLVTVAQLRTAPVPEVVAIFVYLVDSFLWLSLIHI